VIAIDVNEERLPLAAQHGAELTVHSQGQDPSELRKQVQAQVKQRGWNPYQWKIFETSGHPAGQLLAFTLLTFGATLSVVGYTLEKVSVRLANLMAFDAVAQGNWGCLPENYPAALAQILEGGTNCQIGSLAKLRCRWARLFSTRSLWAWSARWLFCLASSNLRWWRFVK